MIKVSEFFAGGFSYCKGALDLLGRFPGDRQIPTIKHRSGCSGSYWAGLGYNTNEDDPLEREKMTKKSSRFL